MTDTVEPVAWRVRTLNGWTIVETTHQAVGLLGRKPQGHEEIQPLYPPSALESQRAEIERLRGEVNERHADAVLIEHLTAQRDRAVEALRPFVDEFESRRDAYIRRYPRHPAVGAANFDKMPDDWPMENSVFKMGDFRRAADATLASMSQETASA